MSRALLDRVKRHRVTRNVVALYLSHFSGLLVPIVTIPYLARVLRPEGFGLVVFAQSLAAWLTLVLEYGFDLSGTRAVARARLVPSSLPGVVAGIQSARLLLLGGVTALAALLYGVVPLLREHPLFLFWAWAYAVVKGLSPFWYFLGVERMRAAAAVDASTKIIAAAGVFLWIHSPPDGWRVLALQALGAGASLLVMTVWLYRDVDVRRPDLAGALRTLREASGIFVFRASSGMYIQANAFILGVLTTPQVVAFFGGAEKIIRAAVNLLNPMSQAFFPHLSHLVVSDPARARRVFGLCVAATVGFGTLMGVVGALAAQPLVALFLGPGYEAAVPVLRVLSLLPFIVAVGTVFGVQWALPMGLDRAFYRLVIAGGALNLLLAAVLAPRMGAIGMAISVVCADLLVSAGLLVLFRMRGFRRSAS